MTIIPDPIADDSDESIAKYYASLKTFGIDSSPIVYYSYDKKTDSMVQKTYDYMADVNSVDVVNLDKFIKGD